MLYEIKSLILPTKSELFFWPALGLFLLVAQNVKRYWQYLSGVSFEDVKNSSDIGLQIQDWVLDQEAALDPRIADFIVWMLLGMIVISVILFFQSSIRNANDERDLLEHMKNPSSRTHELEVYAIKLAIRIGAVLGLLVYMRIFLAIINPDLCRLFFVSTLSLNDPLSWLWAIVSIVAMSLALYAFAVFARIIALRTRLID